MNDRQSGAARIVAPILSSQPDCAAIATLLDEMRDSNVGTCLARIMAEFTQPDVLSTILRVIFYAQQLTHSRSIAGTDFGIAAASERGVAGATGCR